MNIVVIEDGRNTKLNTPGKFYGAVSASFIEFEDTISAWIVESYRNGSIGDCWNYLDDGCVYFKREEDLAYFMLRWS